jgi:hypothetical protein
MSAFTEVQSLRHAAMLFREGYVDDSNWEVIATVLEAAALERETPKPDPELELEAGAINVLREGAYKLLDALEKEDKKATLDLVAYLQTTAEEAA